MEQGLYFVLSIIVEVLAIGLTYWLASAAKNEKLEGRINAKSEQLIDAKVGGLRSSIDGLSHQFAQMQKRIDDGDGDVEKMSERNQRIELAMAQKFGDLKNWMTENFSHKTDLQHHENNMSAKTDKINEHLSQQDQKLARIEATAQSQRGGH